jgi:hypothetical protein
MPSPPPSVVAMSAVLDKLWMQLLAWERELDSREGAIIAWEDGLVASECALERVCMERNTERARTEAI